MEWQPIETAPEGKNVLVYGSDCGFCFAYWSGVRKGWTRYETRQLIKHPPTHWMKLDTPQ